jgi:hypothetical protein
MRSLVLHLVTGFLSLAILISLLRGPGRLARFLSVRKWKTQTNSDDANFESSHYDLLIKIDIPKKVHHCPGKSTSG